MTGSRTPFEIDALMRAAVSSNTEAVMTTIDVERALDRFTSSLQERRSRRRSWLAAAASVALLAGGGGTYLAVGGDDASTTVTAARDVGEDVRWTAGLPAAMAPREITVLGDELLVAGSDRIVRLDAASGEVRGEIAPGGGVSLGGPLAVTDAGVWVTYEDATRRGYARIDVESGSVEAVADVGEPYVVSSGGAGLWAVPSGSALVELEPETGAVLRRVELPFRAFGMWVGDDEVWAQAAAGGALARVDARSGEVTDGPVLGASAPAATAQGALWVVDPTTAELVVVDLDSGQVRTRLPLLDEPTGATGAGAPDAFVAATEDDVYVTTVAADGSRRLTRVDARRGTVVDVVDVGSGSAPTAVAADGDRVYLASFAESRVLALEPPRRDG
jgi:streptogramin lyase